MSRRKMAAAACAAWLVVGAVFLALDWYWAVAACVVCANVWLATDLILETVDD